MTYEEFKSALMEELIHQAGEEVEIKQNQVTKNNGILRDYITIMNKNCIGAPALLVEDFYRCFQAGECLEVIAAELIRFSLSYSVNTMLPDNYFVDYETIEENICFKIIHYERNKEFLKDVPHYRFLDLAVVFYCIADPEVFQHAMITIRNDDMERWGIIKDELFVKAVKNTPRLLPWRFASLNQVVDGLVHEGPKEAMGIIESGCEIILAETAISSMYILTNREKFLGAACMLYPGLLESIANKLNGDLYVIPSSIHECIIMPVTELHSKEELSKLVCHVNEREVLDEEILSDHVYYFDRKLAELH